MTVSIIVTSYNVEKYIAQCLQSLIEQSLNDLEIIVVDDGSTDGTKEIIDSFSKKDERIKTIYFRKNSIGGVGTAANEGLKAAIGEYIGFADGDDWYEKEMFELLFFKAKESNADIAICNYLEYDEGINNFVQPSDFYRWRNGRLKNISSGGIETKKELLKLISVPWRKLYKRTFLVENEIRFPVGDYFYEDNPFHWQCITLAEKFSVVDKVLCYHRTKRQGQSMSTTDSRLLAMYQHYQTIYNWLKAKGIFETYKIELVEWLTNNTIWISRNVSKEYREDLFSAFREAVLMDGKVSARRCAKNITVGLREKMIYRTAVKNQKHMFYLIANHRLGENLLQKMRRGYKEQGIEGLWLNLKRVLVCKIKRLIYYNRSATKRDILRELSDIREELRAIRAGQLFLHEEIRKLTSSHENVNDSLD